MSDPLPFDFSGSHLALDFANTLSGRSDPVQRERLVRYERLVAFAEESGVAGEDRAAAWRAWGEAHPEEGMALVEDARVLREALYRLFRALALDEPIEASDIGILNEWGARLCLGTDLKWHWCDGDDAPDAVLAPIVRAAMDVLTGDRRDRVRMCESDTCQWVFFDHSRNRSRRWCDMATCGNRNKARRFYDKHKDA